MTASAELTKQSPLVYLEVNYRSDVPVIFGVIGTMRPTTCPPRSVGVEPGLHAQRGVEQDLFNPLPPDHRRQPEEFRSSCRLLYLPKTGNCLWNQPTFGWITSNWCILGYFVIRDANTENHNGSTTITTRNQVTKLHNYYATEHDPPRRRYTFCSTGLQTLLLRCCPGLVFSCTAKPGRAALTGASSQTPTSGTE